MRCNLLDEQTILLSLFGNRVLYLKLQWLVLLQARCKAQEQQGTGMRRNQQHATTTSTTNQIRTSTAQCSNQSNRIALMLILLLLTFGSYASWWS